MYTKKRLQFNNNDEFQYSKARLLWLDVLKGIGIILVVVGHVYRNDEVFNWIYSFHMPIFFWVAGYLYKQKGIFQNIKRRFTTIMIPYFAFGLSELVYWVLIERKFRTTTKTIVELFVGLFYGQYNYLDFNVHLWFLPCFYMTVIIHNVLVNLVKKKGANIISIILSLIFIICPLPSLPWGIDWITKYIGFYVLGNTTAEIEIDKDIIGRHKLLFCIGALVLIIINYFLAYFGLKKGVMWFFTAIVGISGVAIISLIFENNRILQYLGRISIVILCVHGPIYRVLAKLMSILFHESTDIIRANVVLSLIIVVVTLIVSALMYEVLFRIAPWVIGKNKNMGSF